MARIITLLVVLACASSPTKNVGAAELTLKELVADIDNLLRDNWTTDNPLLAIQDKSAAVRYLTIKSLDAGKSKDHERALIGALGDNVRWLRYAAAVKLAEAELQANRTAPILVESLSQGAGNFHLWGTMHTIQALYRVGAPALPHLANAVDSPNKQLRENACYVLGQLAGIVKDREHFHRPLAALDSAISRNQFPASRPRYAVTRMKIDGDTERAEAVLREDARSEKTDVRVAALMQMNEFRSNADRFVPVLIESLTNEEPRLIRAATVALWSMRRDHNIDVSAAIPVIATQVEKQLKPNSVHDGLKRFLDDMWKDLVRTAEEDLPEANVLVKNYPLKSASFRSFVMQRLDRGLGRDDGLAASWIMRAHDAAGMAIVDIEFANRTPAGKVQLMKAMQHLPYIESVELLLDAMTDQEAVKWNIPRGSKGSEPLPPGSVPMRVCDEAFKYLRWRLRNWAPLTDALGRRSLTPQTRIGERDKLIATMKNVWEMQGSELLLPSYRMAQTGASDQPLNKTESQQVRQTILDTDVASETKPDVSGISRQHLVIPEPLIAAHEKDPIGVLQVLRSVLKNSTADNARKAYSFAIGLTVQPTIGSKAAATPPADYDQSMDPGGRTRRWIRVRELEQRIIHAASYRVSPGQELDFLAYAPHKKFKSLHYDQLPETLQHDVQGLATSLFRVDALPIGFNPDRFNLVPGKRDNDASIRVFAAGAKGERDLIELSWRADHTDIKWVISENICCLMVPTAAFDSSQSLKILLEQVYRMNGEPDWYQAYSIDLPWPKTLRDGIEISSDINKHPAMDVFVWPIRLDVVIRNGTAYVLTYHRNPQVPGFEPGDNYFPVEFRKTLIDKRQHSGNRQSIAR